MIARFAAAISLLFLAGCGTANSTLQKKAQLVAKIHDSHFPIAHDSYNSISPASDGKVYYVLSSEAYNTAAQMYSFDPATQKIEHLGDLNEACHQNEKKAIA